jgi:hypothetical protein
MFLLFVGLGTFRPVTGTFYLLHFFTEHRVKRFSLLAGHIGRGIARR